MAYRNFITAQRRKQIRKEMLYQVIVEDFCEVFGYSKDSPEFKKFQVFINGYSGMAPEVPADAPLNVTMDAPAKASTKASAKKDAVEVTA